MWCLARAGRRRGSTKSLSGVAGPRIKCVATPDDAFFIPVGGSFEATDLTRGPWDPDSQHAGPPTALIAREIERAATGGSDEQGADSFAQASPAGRNREAAPLGDLIQ